MSRRGSARRRRAAVAALLTLAAVGVVVALRARGPAVAPDWAFRLEPGTTLVFALHHRTSTALRLGGGRGVEGGSLLEGELRLRGLEAAGEGGVRAAASLAGLTRHEVNVLGQDVLAQPGAARAQLEGPEVVVDLAADGTLRGLAAPPDAPALFANTMQIVLADLAVNVRAGQRRWRAAQVTPRGTVEVSYEVARHEGATFTVSGVHAGYARLEGLLPGSSAALETSSLTAELHEEGRVETIDTRHRAGVRGPRGDTIGNMEVEASLRFLRAEEGTSAPPPATKAVALRALPRGPDLAVALLDQKIEGLTGAELAALLERHAATGVVPDHNRFLVRATSLLRKEPALCAALVRLFERDETAIPGKLLVLDLLAGAGTPAAQQALVGALSSRAAQTSVGFPQMLSRTALLAAPTAETQAWLEETYRSRPARGAGTAALALGAVAGQRARAGDDAGSRRVLAELARDLERAEGSAARTDLLQALGNAGAPELVGAVVRWADDESPEVRRAAADALRRTQTRQSEATLLRLSRDAAGGVQGTALGTLGQYALDASLLRSLRDQTLPTIVPENRQQLVTLVAPYAATDPAARDILGAVAADPRADAQSRARARKILAASRDG